MQTTSIRTSCTSCLVVALGLLCSASAQEFRSFDFPGAVDTEATAVTSSGDISGRYFNSDGTLHGFVVHKGVFTSIDVPGALSTDVTWMNERGDIVGAYFAGQGNRGFLLSAGQFTTIRYPADAPNTIATGIGRDESIVGVGSDNGTNYRGYLRKNGVFYPINFPGASIIFQEPTMVEAGRIVGGYLDSNGLHGYLLVAGVYQSIDCPDAPGFVFLSGIDPLGRMAGGMKTPDGHLHGLLVKDGNCIAVDYPSSKATYANSVNSQGDMAGRYTDAEGKTHGFVAIRLAGQK